MSWEPPATRQDFDLIWQRWLLDIEQGKELTYVIRHTDSHEFIGITALHHIQTNTPEIGLWIREDRHGVGFGQETVQSLVEWASFNYKPKYFIYPVAVENMASRKIAESVGGMTQYFEKKTKYDAVTYYIPPKI